MKINEVESLAGITKKNIRFYEEQGLLSPRRNAENGYRDYGEEEVRILKQIKLLRKLGISIEEIRHLIKGNHTVRDCVRRHQVSLERERQNLEQSMEMCQKMQDMDIPLEALDADVFLEEMEELERGGASFQNKQIQDVRVRYVAPILITVFFVALLTGLVCLMIWGYSTSPEDAPPKILLWALGGICFAVAYGVVLALIRRIQEIGKGEVDEAKRY